MSSAPEDLKGVFLMCSDHLHHQALPPTTSVLSQDPFLPTLVPAGTPLSPLLSPLPMCPRFGFCRADCKQVPHLPPRAFEDVCRSKAKGLRPIHPPSS